MYIYIQIDIYLRAVSEEWTIIGLFCRNETWIEVLRDMYHVYVCISWMYMHMATIVRFL